MDQLLDIHCIQGLLPNFAYDIYLTVNLSDICSNLLNNKSETWQ